LLGKIDLSKDKLSTILKVNTEIGEASINLNFDDYQNPNAVKYAGFVDVSGFDLASFFDTNSLGITSFNLNVNGSGFTKESLNTLALGKINSIVVNNYNYKNIELNGNLKAPYFNGSLESLDPNFQFAFEGLLDASGEENIFDFNADIYYADLYALNIVKRDTVADFKGNLNVNLKR